MSSNTLEVSEKKLSVDDFPPVLRKLTTFLFETNQIKSLRDAAERCGVEYNTVYKAIGRARKKGNDYYELLEQLRVKRNRGRVLFVDDAVYDKALTGNTNAAKLFYQSNNYLDQGSGGDRTQVNINFINPAPRPDASIEIIQEKEDKSTIQPLPKPQDIE